MALSQPRDRSGASSRRCWPSTPITYRCERSPSVVQNARSRPSGERLTPRAYSPGGRIAPGRPIERIDRLELASDRDDERPVLDRPVHRHPRSASTTSDREDEQDDEHDAHGSSGRRPARPDGHQTQVAQEATDPCRVPGACGARPREERRIGRSRELRIRMGRHVEAPDQGVDPLVSHLGSPCRRLDGNSRGLGTAGTR